MKKIDVNFRWSCLLLSRIDFWLDNSEEWISTYWLLFIPYFIINNK